MKTSILTLTLIITFNFSAWAHVTEDLHSTAAIDLYAPLALEGSSEKKLELRSAELMISGPIDSTFEGNLTFAAHNNHGESIVEVKEAHLSTSKLVPNSRLRFGKFLLNVGLLNSTHQHDWAFISAPKVQAEFLSEENISDTGAEFTTQLPLEGHWDLTLGMTNGYTFGHSHEEGEAPKVPTHYIRPVNIADLGETGTLQWGLNYLGRTDADTVQTQLYGLDFLFKSPEKASQGFLLQAEVWYRKLSGPDIDTKEDLGAYFYPQMALAENLTLGVRVDLFQELSRTFAGESEKQVNLNYGIVPTLTWNSSESTLMRLAYNYNCQTNQRESDQVNQTIELQWVAMLENL